MRTFTSEHYAQASLFYENDVQAKKAAGQISDGTYFAVLSNVRADSIDVALSRFFTRFSNGSMWLLTVAFLVLFISVSSSRTMMATRGDLAIMRSMGIRVPVIKFAVYMQMLLTLIPTSIAVALFACVAFLVPAMNAVFTFLHVGGYLLIFFGLLLVSVLVSKRHIKKLFRESVKKTLKEGGNA